MKPLAIRKGQTREKAAAGFQEMGTLRCDACGEEFVIAHPPAFVDKSVAARQAHWLEKVLTEDHERDNKHADRIELPD
jgi:rRNA maturation protein Nop10